MDSRTHSFDDPGGDELNGGGTGRAADPAQSLKGKAAWIYLERFAINLESSNIFLGTFFPAAVLASSSIFGSSKQSMSLSSSDFRPSKRSKSLEPKSLKKVHDGRMSTMRKEYVLMKTRICLKPKLL